MRVFITWSGEWSRRVATTLREWLPLVIQFTRPFMSEQDVGKGAKWFPEISKELAESSFGIVCLTPDNITEPWVHFEAGALGTRLDESRVAPLLVGLGSSAMAGPLTQFQMTEFDKDDVRRLVRAINDNAPPKEKLTSKVLDKAFDMYWPEFEIALSEIGKEMSETTPPPARNEREILEEILDLVRSHTRQTGFEYFPTTAPFAAYGTTASPTWLTSVGSGLVRPLVTTPTFPTGVVLSNEEWEEITREVGEALGDSVDSIKIDGGMLVVSVTREVDQDDVSTINQIAERHGLPAAQVTRV